MHQIETKKIDGTDFLTTTNRSYFTPIFYSSRSNFSYSLIVDLQDFLKRDPTLSSLSDNTNLAVDVTIGDSSAGNNFDFVTMTSPNSGIDIPKNFGTIMVPNNR